MTAAEYDPVGDGIACFFRWYRRRHANVSALSVVQPEGQDRRPGIFLPEQHVLIGSALDAMATDWARVFRPELNTDGAPAGNRMSEFLRANANKTGIFDKVAAPMLADHLQAEGEDQAATVVRKVTGDRRNGIVRFAEEDPAYGWMTAHAEIVALDLNNRLRPRRPRRALDRFRYGEVIYADYRCHWSHNLRGSERLAASNHNEMMGCAEEMDHRVRYENVSIMNAQRTGWTPLRRPVFSLRWLLAIYQEAIDSFERQCVEQRRDPMPGRG